MIIDATFWVAISFFIFVGVIVYLKVPQKTNSSLSEKINEIKKELEEAEKLKNEARNLLSEYESKIDKSKKETKEIISKAEKDSEKKIIEKTQQFYKSIDEKKKNLNQKISQMKENALKDIKNASVKIAIEATENLIEKSIDKNNLETLYNKSLDHTKASLKKIKA